MTSTKKWLIFALILIIGGTVILGVAMRMFNWDFSELFTSKYETNNYEIQDSCRHITVEASTADIQIVPAQDGKISVVCYETANMKHRVLAENDRLTVSVQNSRKWYEYIGIQFGMPKITLYLPQGSYGDIIIDAKTGRIEIPDGYQFENIRIKCTTGNISNHASAAGDMHMQATTGNILTEHAAAGNLSLSVTTGKITATDITCNADASIHVSTGKAMLTGLSCKNLASTGSTGNIELINTVASEGFNIQRSTGKVTFDRCDAAEIYVKTDTGDVKGSFLTDKIIFARSDTGTVRVPQSTTGGKCEITTDTGNIIITIE